MCKVQTIHCVVLHAEVDKLQNTNERSRAECSEYVATFLSLCHYALSGFLHLVNFSPQDHGIAPSRSDQAHVKSENVCITNNALQHVGRLAGSLLYCPRPISHTYTPGTMRSRLRCCSHLWLHSCNNRNCSICNSFCIVAVIYRASQNASNVVQNDGGVVMWMAAAALQTLFICKYSLPATQLVFDLFTGHST